MNILHITDFHYHSKKDLPAKIVNSISDAIIKTGSQIDFVFFTGDLVQKGETIELFNEAKDILFEKLSTSLNIHKSNFIFCPGNHDINRNLIHRGVKAYVQLEVKNNEELNKFYREDGLDFQNSLKPSEVFKIFERDFHESYEPTASVKNIIKDLYSIYIRDINQKEVAIVCLNSAWLSDGNDYSNLYIPTELLAEINTLVKPSDCKIMLLHHPLYFLKEFNYFDVELMVHQNYDMMFTGHIHKTQSSTYYAGANGIYNHIAKASLSSEEALGCSIIEYNDINSEVVVKEIYFNRESNSCQLGESVIFTLPFGETKREQIEFRKKLTEKIPIELDKANELLLQDVQEDASNMNFLHYFNSPILKTESSTGIESTNPISIAFEELYKKESNYLIMGKDKCGKTALLKRIQLDDLINYSKKGIIPYSFDFKEWESKFDDRFTLTKEIANYYSINKKQIETYLKNGSIRLLIDNFNPQSAIYTYLNDFLKEYQKVSFVICTDYNTPRMIDIYTFGGATYKKLYIHDITRKEIAVYTEKWMPTRDDRGIVQEKIVNLCKQLELPLNYWTISLLLLIYNKSSDGYHRNLFEILDLCVDEVLRKKYLTLSKSRVTYDQLKRICGELAVELYARFEKNVYSASQLEIIQIIKNSIDDNERTTAEPTEIFNYLTSVGVLKLKEDGVSYTFRLNGFFEYFLSYHMTKNEAFKESILSDGKQYVKFKNELEIYSGFKRNDLNFLENIYFKTKNIIDPLFISYYINNLDDVLKDKIQQPQIITDRIKRLHVKRSLTSLEKASVEDVIDGLEVNADVHKKEEIDANRMDPELLEKYIATLARVYRNSDDIRGNQGLINDIFDYILDSYCYYGFYLIDKFSHEIKLSETENIESNPEMELLKLVSNFAPFMSEISLYDGIGHYNIENIVKRKIEELEIVPAENQLKLFMLYYLLVDIDLQKNKGFIDRSLEVIRMPILKTMILVKLNFYLAFKTNGSKSLNDFIGFKIEQAKLNLDARTDRGQIHKNLSKTKKRSFSKR